MKLTHLFLASLTLALAAPAAADTVAAVKALADASLASNVTGIVTSVGGSTGRLQFTIQDATGGLLIDKGTLTYTQPNVGDSVTIVSGTKTTFSGTIELIPTTAGDIVVNNTGNPQPTIVTYPSIAAALAASTTDHQGRLVRIQNVYFTVAPAGPNWPATGGVNYTVTDNGTDTMTVRVTSDIHGLGAAWSAKLAPTASSSDRVDIVGVGSLFSSVNQIYINDPVGTSAKTDATGPIRPPTTSVGDWNLY